MKKRWLSFLLALSMMVSSLPTHTLAQELPEETEIQEIIAQPEFPAVAPMPAEEAETTEEIPNETFATEEAEEEAPVEIPNEETEESPENSVTEEVPENPTAEETAPLCIHEQEADCILCQLEQAIAVLPELEELAAMDAERYASVNVQIQDIIDQLTALSQEEQILIRNLDKLFALLSVEWVPDEARPPYVHDERIPLITWDNAAGNRSGKPYTVQLLDEGFATLDSYDTAADIDEAADFVREAMTSREASLTFFLPAPYGLNDSFFDDLLALAFKETGNPKQGDYLHYNFNTVAFTGQGRRDPELGFGYVLTLDFSYHSSADAATAKLQEQFVDSEVARLTAPLRGKSDYEKVYGVWHYICETVRYDNPIVDDSYTAWKALAQHTAVCQGYSTLFYRMVLELGVDVRCIRGIGNGGPHMWNIVRLGNKYYYVDCTWDEGVVPGNRWFLKGSQSFPNHSPSSEFTDAAFLSRYPISTADYSINTHETHTVVVDAAKEASCTASGLTEGSHCSVCGKVLTAQQTIPAKGHTEVLDAAKTATCTETGLTEGRHCSVCEKVLLPQQTIPLKDHTEVLDAAKAATCTETGLTEGKHCSVCEKVLLPQQTIPLKDHTEVLDAAKAATCTQSGLTSGKHCSVCKKILLVPNSIPALGHNFQAGKCTVCGETDPAYLSDGLHWENGKLHYYLNGSFASSFIGLVQQEGEWYNVHNGIVDDIYTGLIRFNGTLYYVTGGKVDFNYCNLASIDGEWYYADQGVVYEAYTGLVRYGNILYYVNQGKCDWNFYSLYPLNGEYVYVCGGVVYENYCGLVRHTDGILYYVTNSVADWNFVGLGSLEGQWFYVDHGVVYEEYTGLVPHEGIWYYVINGAAAWNYTGLVEYYGNKYYVQGGVIYWGVNGVVPIGKNYYYLNNSTLDTAFSGTIRQDGVTYTVTGGIAVKK